MAARVGERNGNKRKREQKSDEEEPLEDLGISGGQSEFEEGHDVRKDPRWALRIATCPHCQGCKDLTAIAIHGSNGLETLLCTYCKKSTTAARWMCECGKRIHQCPTHKDDRHRNQVAVRPNDRSTSHDRADLFAPPIARPYVGKGGLHDPTKHYAIVDRAPVRGTRLYDYSRCPRLRAKFPKLASFEAELPT